MQIISDVNFNTQLYNIPEIMGRKDASTPVYIYKFNYEGELNCTKQICAFVASYGEFEGI